MGRGDGEVKEGGGRRKEGGARRDLRSKRENLTLLTQYSNVLNLRLSGEFFPPNNEVRQTVLDWTPIASILGNTYNRIRVAPEFVKHDLYVFSW